MLVRLPCFTSGGLCLSLSGIGCRLFRGGVEHRVWLIPCPPLNLPRWGNHPLFPVAGNASGLFTSIQDGGNIGAVPLHRSACRSGLFSAVQRMFFRRCAHPCHRHDRFSLRAIIPGSFFWRLVMRVRASSRLRRMKSGWPMEGCSSEPLLCMSCLTALNVLSR